MDKAKNTALIVAIAGAVKLSLQAFGVPLIDDESYNQLVNAVAIIANFGLGIYINHRKPKVTE